MAHMVHVLHILERRVHHDTIVLSVVGQEIVPGEVVTLHREDVPQR